MDHPNCQNCGARLEKISPKRRYAQCTYCGTLHNVSQWFASRLPPVIVEVVEHEDAFQNMDYQNRFGTGGMGIVFFIGGVTCLAFTFMPKMVGHNPSGWFWILRAVLIATALAGVAMGFFALSNRGYGGRR